ncbi:glycoside hydrolase/deacetylase [Serendipita vermifera]|nr:glycoside hydrolase/deacetylase [Serendipita vermifera]
MSGLLSRKAFVVPFLFATCALAHDEGFAARYGKRASHLRRQEPYPSGTDPAYSVPPLESIVPTPGGYTENTLPVEATYTAGASPTMANFPALPAATIIPSEWPELDHIPPVDSEQVKQWMDEIDWSTVPDYQPTASRICSDPANAEAFAQRGADGRCWWSCGQCTRDVDITTCSESMQYGHTYDDGPGFYTNKLLRYLESKSLHATFFIVGSRAISHPDILQYEYMNGHELSIHTWSHGGPDLLGLTSMTNEQIVAELGWTRKAIKDITGVTPTTMRPPYGDIDDRVRAIALGMGMMPVIWTSVPDSATGEAIEWDSKDYLVHVPVDQGGVESVSNQRRFEQTLDWSANFTDHGVIVLQHDIYVEAVNLAIGQTIPYLLQHNPPFDVKPVMQCQGRPLGDAYVETNTNPDSPALSGSGDIATRTSNLGYAGRDSDDVSSIPSRTYVSTTGPQTGTSTTTRSSGSLRASATVGMTGTFVAALLLAISIVY